MRKTSAFPGSCRETAWRDNGVMDRYVFYAKDSLDAKAVRAARATVVSLGAAVVRAGVGTLLVEVEATQVRKVARALPDWRYSAERHATRLPEKRVAQRVREAAAVR